MSPQSASGIFSCGVSGRLHGREEIVRFEHEVPTQHFLKTISCFCPLPVKAGDQRFRYCQAAQDVETHPREFVPTFDRQFDHTGDVEAILSQFLIGPSDRMEEPAATAVA